MVHTTSQIIIRIILVEKDFRLVCMKKVVETNSMYTVTWMDGRTSAAVEWWICRQVKATFPGCHLVTVLDCMRLHSAYILKIDTVCVCVFDSLQSWSVFYCQRKRRIIKRQIQSFSTTGKSASSSSLTAVWNAYQNSLVCVKIYVKYK